MCKSSTKIIIKTYYVIHYIFIIKKKNILDFVHAIKHTEKSNFCSCTERENQHITNNSMPIYRILYAAAYTYLLYYTLRNINDVIIIPCYFCP